MSQERNALLRARRKIRDGEAHEMTYAEREALLNHKGRKNLAAIRKLRRAEHAERVKAARASGKPWFMRTSYGWRVVVPVGYMDRGWSKGDELEVLTAEGETRVVTLDRMFFGLRGGGGDCWSYLFGRQSQLERFEHPTPAPLVQPELKVAESLLDEEDLDRVSTGAGAAYLNARKKRRW